MVGLRKRNTDTRGTVMETVQSLRASEAVIAYLLSNNKGVSGGGGGGGG